MRMSEKQQRAMAGHALLFPSSLPSQISTEMLGEGKSFSKDLDLSLLDRKKLQKRITRT